MDRSYSKDLEDHQFWDTDNSGVADTNKYDSAGDLVDEPERKQTIFGNLFGSNSASKPSKRREKVHYGADDDGGEDDDGAEDEAAQEYTRKESIAEDGAAQEQFTAPTSKRWPQVSFVLL